MEFHDSTFDGLDGDGANLTLRFSAAYIHESEGEPGLDAGIVWFQEVRLHFANTSTSGSMSELPCYLWDGRISLAGESLQMIPVPLEHSGEVHLKLIENGDEVGGGQVEVTGTHVRLELCGGPRHLKKFPGARKFENVSTPSERHKSYRCPCCGFKTLYGKGHYEICPVCFWEDDGQDDHDADDVRGGPNGTLSLTEARANFRNLGACETRALNKVRRPLPDEQE
jgi:Cysteine-rich CPCC